MHNSFQYYKADSYPDPIMQVYHAGVGSIPGICNFNYRNHNKWMPFTGKEKRPKIRFRWIED